MPLRQKTSSSPPLLAVSTVSRRPQQGRSKASLERMLAASEKLMVQRGNEEFTLQEVSKVGKVSIGSIYLRFESKDNLVRAVIAREMERIATDEDRMIANVSAASRHLSDFVPEFVKAYAELLRHHAPLLRLSMARAEHDPLVSEPGRNSAYRSAAIVVKAMLAYRDEFGGSDPDKRANAAYQIIFATLARHLSLGSTGESAYRQDWNELKTELGRMCLAYLKHPEWSGD